MECWGLLCYMGSSGGLTEPVSRGKEARGRGHFAEGTASTSVLEGIACVAELRGMRGKVVGGEDRG